MSDYISNLKRDQKNFFDFFLMHCNVHLGALRVNIAFIVRYLRL